MPQNRSDGVILLSAEKKCYWTTNMRSTRCFEILMCVTVSALIIGLTGLSFWSMYKIQALEYQIQEMNKFMASYADLYEQLIVTRVNMLIIF